MLCQSNPAGFTVEQLMDQLYPQVFNTFVRSNPALQQRANFYRGFLDTFNTSMLFTRNETSSLQVFELGSGTGVGSANNLKILSEKFTSGVNYFATDKRSKLVSMTQKNLFSVLNPAISSAEVYIHDSIHHMTKKQLRNFGIRDGVVHIYFAEHSTYSELYDLNKALAFFSNLRSYITECGVGFIVVQTEQAEMQRLVERNIKSQSDYSKHIVNMDKALDALNWKIHAKYLNQANLNFPVLNINDWQSIRNRESNLTCFNTKNTETAIELMTFIKKPINCLNDTELESFVDKLQGHLSINNNQISIDEYIYVIENHCPARKKVEFKMSEAKNQELTPMTEAAILGFLRGTAYSLNKKLVKNGISKRKANILSQSTCLLGFFATKFYSHSQFHEIDYLTALYNAAIDTGFLFFFNMLSERIDIFLERSIIMLENHKKSWLVSGIKTVKSLLPFSIYAAKENLYTASAAMVLGGVAETVTVKILA